MHDRTEKARQPLGEIQRFPVLGARRTVGQRLDRHQHGIHFVTEPFVGNQEDGIGPVCRGMGLGIGVGSQLIHLGQGWLRRSIGSRGDRRSATHGYSRNQRGMAMDERSSCTAMSNN